MEEAPTRLFFPGPAWVAMNRVGLVALLLVFGLAGCASTPTADGPAPLPPLEAEATTLAWGLSDCSFVIASATVAASAVQGLLPDGFAPAPARSGDPAEAEFHMDAYECEGGIDLDGSTREAVLYGSYYIPAVPPDELRVAGVDAYFVKLDTLELDDDRRETLQEAGFPIHGGQGHVTQTGPTWDGFLDLGGAGGSGGFILRGTATDASAPSGELPFVEYTPLAEGGLARWQARLHDSEIVAGSGFVLVTGLPSQVLGSMNPAQPIPVEFIAGTWNLDQANVTFPIAWPK